MTPAVLALEDGTTFEGEAFGAVGETTGEVVFNTSMTGYQEILTDPSYANQMLTFTYPHIGNVGVNDEDIESAKIQATGMIVREASKHFSNFRATKSLEAYLIENKLVGISGIDTRALVLHLREHGSMMGVISSESTDVRQLVENARAVPSMAGQNLVDSVTCSEAYEWTQGVWRLGTGYNSLSKAELESRPLVVAVDYGVKYNILRLLLEHGFRVRVVPAQTTAAEILAMNPAGVFLSNGPGDPAAVDYAIESVKELVGKKPLFGICLGHQILGLALGGTTYKLKFGHRGANHPVREKKTGRVEITVQNHGFASDDKQLPAGAVVSHLNLNDSTVEGFEIPDAKAFSIQYHPEASAGPHDARHLFRRFRELVEGAA